MIIYDDDGIGYDVVPRKVINNIEVELLEQIKTVENMGCSAWKFRLALDNENVLDKIRAEIEQNAYPIVHGVNNHELGMTLYGILQIIDKYKVESEV